MAASVSARPILDPSTVALRQRRHRRPQPRRQLLHLVPRATPSPSASNTSFPPYEVVAKSPEYDLRIYAAHFAVECDYERRDEGFERIGSYASGANEEGARFAPSQPVVMHFPPGTANKGETEGPKVMSVHVGPRLGRAGGGGAGAAAGESTPPAPTTPPPPPTRAGVRLAARGGDVVAASRVKAQYATPEATLSAVASLRSALERDGLKICERDRRGAFRLAQYGAMFQLEERVNEVQLRVEL